MPARNYVPDRGDAVWITFDPATGHEQRGARPALVVTPRAYNARAGLAIVCAITSITSSSKGYPFEVRIPEGLKVAGTVLADQVRTIDWLARRVRFACSLPPATTLEVLGKLRTLVT